MTQTQPSFQVGDQAPDFQLLGDDEQTHRLSDFRGSKVILYFYPKDDTPGCTVEACDFRDRFPTFSESNATVIGVSPDSVSSHKKFKQKYKLPFLLLSDPEKQVAKQYGAYGDKSLWGKLVGGMIRSTFVIDEQGRFAKIYPKVSAKGHAASVAQEMNL